MINLGKEKRKFRVPYSNVVVDVKLKKPDKDSFVEVNFKEMVCSKREDVLNMDTFLGENDDAGAESDNMQKMADYFEKKYGSQSGILSEDWGALGHGYDEDDPLIDNSEPLDDSLPPSMSAEHGGFYVNCGKLKLQRSEDFQFGKSKEGSLQDETESSGEAGTILVKKKSKKKPLSIDESKISQKKLKPKTKIPNPPDQSKKSTKEISQTSSSDDIGNEVDKVKDYQSSGEPAEDLSKLTTSESMLEVFKELDPKIVTEVSALLSHVSGSNDSKKIFAHPETRRLLLSVYDCCTDLPTKMKSKLNSVMADQMKVGRSYLTKLIRNNFIRRLKEELTESIKVFGAVLSSENISGDSDSLSRIFARADVSASLRDLVHKSLQLFPNNQSKVEEYKDFLSNNFKALFHNRESSFDSKFLMSEVKKCVPGYHSFHDLWDSEDIVIVDTDTNGSVEILSSTKFQDSSDTRGSGEYPKETSSSELNAVSYIGTSVALKVPQKVSISSNAQQNLLPSVSSCVSEDQNNLFSTQSPQRAHPSIASPHRNLPYLYQPTVSSSTAITSESHHQWVNRPTGNIRTVNPSIRFIAHSQIRHTPGKEFISDIRPNSVYPVQVKNYHQQFHPRINNSPSSVNPRGGPILFQDHSTQPYMFRPNLSPHTTNSVPNRPGAPISMRLPPRGDVTLLQQRPKHNNSTQPPRGNLNAP